MTQQAQPRAGAIETHTIDFIPLSERRGKPWHLFTLWFGANSVIVSVVTAAILVGGGMSFAWSCIAMVVGFALGGFLAAFHSAQGPQLGIPQMIQSRAQFGYVGGIVPMIIAEINYLVFFAAAPAICGLLTSAVWGWNVYAVAVIVTAITFVVALFGYDLSHRLAKYLSVASIVVFGILTILVLAHSGISHPTTQNLHQGGFQLGLFLTGVAITFVYAAGYAPYIADYSRYLPEETSTKATAWWTYAGIVISGIWLFVLGAYLTAVTAFGADTLGSVIKVSDSFSKVFTAVLVIVVVGIQILQGSLSMYAGGNTAISITTSLRRTAAPVQANLRTRLWSLVPFAVLCLIATIAYSKSFTSAFTDALGVVLILLIPWSAINLADFYFVRNGHYDVEAIFDPNGKYGKVNLAGAISFILGFAVELPFANLGFWVGPIAKKLDGGDISWLVGIVVSGVCYLAMTRSDARVAVPVREEVAVR
ncbi:MAG: purine-cytosine permease family protein [Marmoricola sp.]